MIILEESPPVYQSDRHGCIKKDNPQKFRSSRTFIEEGHSEPFEYKSHMCHEEKGEMTPVPTALIHRDTTKKFPYSTPMFVKEKINTFFVPDHSLFVKDAPEVRVLQEPRAMFYKEDIHTHPYKAAMFEKQDIKVSEATNAIFMQESPEIYKYTNAMFLEEKLERFDYASPIYFEEIPKLFHPKTSFVKEENPENMLPPNTLFLKEDIKNFEATRSMFLKEIPENSWAPRAFFKFEKPSKVGELNTLYEEDLIEITKLERAFVVCEDFVENKPFPRALFIKEEPKDLGKPVTFTIQEEPEENFPVKTSFVLEEKIEVFYQENYTFTDEDAPDLTETEETEYS